MNKTILFLMLMLGAFHLSTAQDTLKATAGNVSIELNFNPFQGQLSLNNSINQIKLRKFLTDNIALRAGFNVDQVVKKDKKENVYGSNPYFLDVTKKSSNMGLNLGIEKHFSGTRRLSSFVGAEVYFTSKNSTHIIKDNDFETTIKGAWQEQVLIYTDNLGRPVYGAKILERGFNEYGVNLISGFDFYITEKFYFGYEILYGLSSLKYKDIDVSSTPSNNPPSTIDETNREFRLGGKLINGIRLGFIF